MRVGERSLEYRARPVKVYGWRIKVTSHPNSPRKTRNEGDLQELSLKLVLRAFVTLVQRNGQRTFVIFGADQEDRSLWERERRAYNSVAFCKLSKISGLWQYYYDIGQSLSLVYIRLQVSRKLFSQNILWKMASICRHWPSLKCSQSARYFYSGKQLKFFHRKRG